MKDFGVPDFIMHHGIKGQKWGIRRYQNPDGSYTPEGMKRYGINQNGWMNKRGRKRYADDWERTILSGDSLDDGKYKTSYMRQFDKVSEYNDAVEGLKQLNKAYGANLKLGANSRGEFSYGIDDDDLRRNGYTRVNSMDDYFNTVRMSELDNPQTKRYGSKKNMYTIKW
jgi:hypothetical protein